MARVQQLTLNKRTERVVLLAGLIVPFLLFAYGLAIKYNFVSNIRDFNTAIFYITSLSWMLLGIYQYLKPPKSRSSAILNLIAYHLFAVNYIVYITGVAMPFTACALVLFLASYVYFSMRGLVASVFVVFLASVADIMLHIGDIDYIISASLYALGAIIVGLICSIIITNLEVDRLSLVKSQQESILQHERVITIVNNLADAVISTNKNGVVELYNSSSLDLLDTNKDINKEYIDDIIKLFDRENKPFRFAKAFKTTRGVVVRDDLRATISGETLSLSVVFSPIRSNNSSQPNSVEGFVIILRNITKQKSLEEERDEFISVISHELRTPLTIAEGAISNLQLVANRGDTPKHILQDNIDLSYNQILFLARMVNDLSTLSRAERGVADATEIINVDELIKDLYKEYSSEAKQKNLSLDLEIDAKLGKVEASRLYLKEMLQNFITNAIKYTKTGEITIIVKKVKGNIYFAVKDTGIGISKSDQAKIFNKFWRSEDYRTRETGGTGLGLYVTQKLAKKLNVNIELSSRLNHGSTFSFTLPSKQEVD